AHILSSRGCPFDCRFCASQLMWKRRVTYKSVDRILDEMHYVNNRFHPTYFTFWDEVFTLNKKRLREFCFNYDLPQHWRCDTRADSLTDDMASMMKNAGCGQMSIGVECGDDNILRYIGKNESINDFRRAANILNRHEIQWKAYMIIGFPGDTEKIIRDSLNFVKSLQPFRITLSFFTPYKGTELYHECKKLGLINSNYDEALYSHQSPHNHFCPNISKAGYTMLRQEITNEVDQYNQEALKIWK
ncbi:MAG: B12-binding domain-containing radical SAM protein, partial [Candidatus Hodarchaeales archaeon]